MVLSSRAGISVYRLGLLLSLLFETASMSLADLHSKCACGNVALRISIADTSLQLLQQLPTLDCHCRSCRRYHVAAFVSYLQVPRNAVKMEGVESLQTYTDTCDELGLVERWFCRQCSSKIATRVVTGKDDNETTNNASLLINMGNLEDDTIPELLSEHWKTHRQPWCLRSKAPWTYAQPQWNKSFRPSIREVTGGCACGTCRYQIKYGPPTELQHCYCQLCRKLSGSPFMTWVPVENTNLQWQTQRLPTTASLSTSPNIDSEIELKSPPPSSSPPPLVRTTEHGQRHVCPQCGGVLTIVYDDQPGITWPASGGFDDDTLPPTTEEMSRYMHRVLHICCTWKQPWYELPNDGLPHIDYAS